MAQVCPLAEPTSNNWPRSLNAAKLHSSWRPWTHGCQEQHGDIMWDIYIYIQAHLGLSENSVPLNPMVLLIIIIPIKWL